MDIILTEEESAAFCRFNESDTAQLSRYEFNLLLKKGLVLNAMDGEDPWFSEIKTGSVTISQKGKELRQLKKQEAKQNLIEKRHHRVNATLAILALILSALSLLLDLFQWLF